MYIATRQCLIISHQELDVSKNAFHIIDKTNAELDYHCRYNALNLSKNDDIREQN